MKGLKSKIVWQEDKDFGKVCTLTESALNGIIAEATKNLQEELEQAKKVKVVEHFEAYGQCRDSRRIAELEAQIEELKAECDLAIEGRDIKIKELGERCNQLLKDKGALLDQIEKMKNWCNCKNYQQCLIELAEQGKGMNPSECCVNCKKWETKEK